MNAINIKPMREKTQAGIRDRSDLLVCPNIYLVGISGLGSSSGLFLGHFCCWWTMVCLWE